MYDTDNIFQIDNLFGSFVVMGKKGYDFEPTLNSVLNKLRINSLSDNVNCEHLTGKKTPSVSRTDRHEFKFEKFELILLFNITQILV